MRDHASGFPSSIEVPFPEVPSIKGVVMDSERWSAVPPERVPGYLASMDLAEETLRQAIAVGLGAAADCTGHDPIGLPGTLVWGKGTRFLRDALALQGWGSRSERNFPTVVHPSRTFEIAVTAGNKHTGRRTVLPRTRRKRGAATESAVHRNQMSMAGFDPAFDEPDADERVEQTWFLLHYHDLAAEETRLELSLPATYENGNVVGWRRRLILDPLPGGPEFHLLEEEPEQIDVEIKPRTG
jgi:hypothetical protein